MTQTENILRESKNTEAKRLAAVFIPLLFCYVGGGVAAFLLSGGTDTVAYAIDPPIPSGGVYEALSALSRSLGSGIFQLFLIFLSVFTFFPTWVAASAAIFRGICTGCSLVPIREGMVMSTGSPEVGVSLYFLASVLFLLLSAVSCTTADTLGKYRSRHDRRNSRALLFEYVPFYLVTSGGILALSAFAVLFC